MSENTNLIKNSPSRSSCEEVIRRILMTEVLEKGTNEHFKTASDFMSYFESLYPASPALTKQVQRAVAAMAMPKDDRGYFIINKTQQQLDQDKEISFILKKTQATVETLGQCETLFLKCEKSHCNYLMNLISQCETFNGKYITFMETSNGLLFLTSNSKALSTLIESLINR